MSLYYLLKPTNPPYPTKNAGSWQISPLTLTIPPRGSGLSTTRLRPIDATSHFLHASLLLRPRNFVNNVFSQSRSPSVSATTTRSVTQPLPPAVPASNLPPVASVPPSPFAALSRSTFHHQTAKQHPHFEIVHPRDTARTSTNSLLADNPATREYVFGHASDSQVDPTRQSNPGSDSEMRGHDDRDQGPSQVCPSVHSVCMHIHLRPCDQSQLLPARASRCSSSSLSRVPSRRMSKAPLFLPFPSPSTANSPSEPHSPQLGRANRNSDPLDIIYVIPSPNSSALPPQRRPRRSPRKTKN